MRGYANFLPMRHDRFLLPLVVLGTIMVFVPVCGHEFLGYDDSVNITGNPYLERFSVANILHFWQAPHLKLYIPLTYSLWSVQAELSRLVGEGTGAPLNPHLFHTVNILLHSTTTAIVFLLLRRLRAVPWAAAAGTLLFAVHPLQVGPVAWVTGFKDLLSGFWSMTALWQFTLALQSTAQPPAKSRLHHCLALAAFVLAMLSKPNAVIVPLLAGVIGLFELGQSRRRLILTLSPWVLCALPIGLITRQAQPVTDTDLLAPLWHRFLVAGDAVTFYLFKLALPLALGPDYGRTLEEVLAQPSIYLTGVLPYLLVVYLIWKRPQPLSTSACLFLIALLPVLGFIPFNFQQVSTVAGRYLYLSMLGPAFAVAMLLPRTSGNIRTKALVLAVLTLLAAKTMVQERHWQNPLTFSQHAVEINPDSWFFHNNLGIAYHTVHETERAIASFKKSIDLNPEYELPFINLGVVYKDTGQHEMAIASYLKALAISPDLANVHNDLAMVYYTQGDTAQAIDHLNKALAINPDYDNAYANLGIVHTGANNPKEALTAYKRAVEINPDFAEAYINLGALYKDLANPEAATACLRKAIDLRPNRPEAYNNLGLLYLETGFSTKAIPLFTKATETGGKSPIPWHNLGQALLAAGRSDEATAALRQAIAIDPRYAPARDTLSAVDLKKGQYRSGDIVDQAKARVLSETKPPGSLEPYRTSL